MTLEKPKFWKKKQVLFFFSKPEFTKKSKFIEKDPWVLKKTFFKKTKTAFTKEKIENKTENLK